MSKSENLCTPCNIILALLCFLLSNLSQPGIIIVLILTTQMIYYFRQIHYITFIQDLTSPHTNSRHIPDFLLFAFYPRKKFSLSSHCFKVQQQNYLTWFRSWNWDNFYLNEIEHTFIANRNNTLFREATSTATKKLTN